MIKITGMPGEGAGMVTAVAIKSLLALENEQYIVFLIDDTSEFKPLGVELDAQFINVEMDMNQYNSAIVSLYDKLNFSKRLIIFNTYGYDEDDILTKLLISHLEDIKAKISNKILIMHKNVYN